MKNHYLAAFAIFFLVQWLVPGKSFAQCADGSNPTPVLIDTTIKFKTGATTTVVKFPQFDPQNGMLRCVKLTVTMIGVVDTVSMQNLSSETQTASFDYVRNDQMTGPGLTTALTNSYSKYYGPYSVTQFDGDFTAGTDYHAIPRDTVLRNTTIRTLTDSTEIAQFYGHDSVSYTYQIDVSTAATITGGSSQSLVLTSALVNFKFEYCKCPKVTLPIGLKNFTVNRTSSETANLSWEGENDDYLYTYDVEASRDGRHFSPLATLNRKYTANPLFLYAFRVPNNDYGWYYFRVRQHWANGYVRYTTVKAVEFTNPLFAGSGVYPNPSSGLTGIKLVNVRPGKLLVQVSNAQGQQVAMKEALVASTDYIPLAPLASGVYWVKITDAATRTSCVKQLVVQ